MTRPGKASLVVDGIRGRYILAMPDGGLYVTGDGDKPDESRHGLVRQGRQENRRRFRA